MSRQTGPRILTTVAVVTMVVSAIGFVAMLILNAFVLDEYDKYGEVQIPGKSSLQLPAGEVTVTFHTTLVGSTSGSGLPVPKLGYTITGPEGVGDMKIDENYGTTTTVNNDARIRIGQLHVPVAGSYHIDLDGKVSAYLDPTLAFGRGSSYGNVPWILAAIFGFATVDLFVARFWAVRVRRAESVSGFPPPPPDLGYQPASFTPSDEGIRIQQLNSLARLRDSGALTELEFQAEKKRLLDGT